MADRRKRSPRTPRTALIPGAFEGETVTRRRFMVGARQRPPASPRPPRSRCRRSASRSARSSSATGSRWQDVGPLERLPGHHLRAAGDHAHARHRRGRQDDRLHAQAQPGDRRPAEGPVRRLRRDLHPLHAPRLPGALRRGRAALHLPVPRRRLRLPGQASPAARRCARSTASTRARSRAGSQVGPRYCVNSELERFPPRDPGEPLDGIGQYLYPRRFDAANKPAGAKN